MGDGRIARTPCTNRMFLVQSLVECINRMLRPSLQSPLTAYEFSEGAECTKGRYDADANRVKNKKEREKNGNRTVKT